MRMKPNNPFLISGYYSTELFCDRKTETDKILNALRNGRNMTLISPRRMGKTGLIKHAFYFLEKENNYTTIYLDIFATQNLKEFVQLFGANILGALDTNIEKIISKVGSMLKSCKPTISFDEISGQPQIGLEISSGQEEAGLKEIFEYIGNSKRRCVIAIDEFQQIAEYPEKGVEALLRSYIQFIPNAHFIFAGSKQHIMQEMFLSAKRPFFQSTQIMAIGPIELNAYYEFANIHLLKKDIHLTQEIFLQIYNEFEGHTWYIQAILNRIYSYDITSVDSVFVNKIIAELTEEGIFAYQNLIEAYTVNAIKLMKAISKEGCVVEINASSFLSKYDLGAASSVNTSLKKLLQKEVIYKSEKGYMVYDRFMALWLRRQP